MNTKRELLFGYSITSGPGRTDLIRAFVHARDDHLKNPISFEIVKDRTITDGERPRQKVQTRNVKITGLRYDGDTRDAFVVEGDLDICYSDKTYANPLKNCKFTACYDVTTGKGRANFLVPS